MKSQVTSLFRSMNGARIVWSFKGIEAEHSGCDIHKGAAQCAET